MSKSKKNVIDPENIIADFGADSVRLFILSDSIRLQVLDLHVEF